MKSGLALVSLLFAVLLVQGYARTERVGDSRRVGKVEALYEEAHAGVYVPRHVADRSRAPLWVHVHFDRPLEDGSSAAVAALPGDMSVGVDDTVEVQLGDRSKVDDRGPERNIITAVLDRADGRPGGEAADLRAAFAAPSRVR